MNGTNSCVQRQTTSDIFHFKIAFKSLFQPPSTRPLTASELRLTSNPKYPFNSASWGK